MEIPVNKNAHATVEISKAYMVIGKWRKYLAASKLTIGIEANPSTKVIPSSPKSFLNQTMTLFFLENFLSKKT